MATATIDKPVNGNYHVQPNYHNPEAYQQGHAVESQPPVQVSDQSHGTTATPPSSTEIGWYFVEQYYNTMSKDPGSLHLYYNKKSQLVAGNEAEKVNVAVGQKKISEMIKKMDIQDCKVRVTNVDSQESAKSILVQVIGEMSNRAAPHRKFVQTFILAEQPTGYYVLNDVFRYIVDEEEEDEPVNDVEGGQAQTAESEIAPPNLAISGDPAEQEDVVEKVDQKLKQEVLDKPGEPLPTALAAPNGINASDASAEKAPEDSSISTKSDAPVEEQAAESADIEEIVQPEKPRDPDPTPIASPPKPTKSTPTETPAQPPKPTAPKTWANLVASKGATATPINPGPKASTTATTTTSNSKASVAPIKGNTTPPTPATEDSTVKPQQNGANGWQTAGTDKQRQGRQHSQSVSSTMGPDSVLAYVKNVTDKVDASILKAKLTDYGKLLYFDVSRQKNCAFVEFETSAAYNACVAANPHNIGGEQVFVEERRPRQNAYGGNFNSRGGIRGGRPGPNERPGSQGRGGFNKDSGRGAYGSRGRGGAMTPRGRGGQPQPA